MSEKFPKVDVFLSSYNHAAFLRESIDSILRQSYQNFTLTIVDDGSTDESREIIRSYDDPRIKAILLEQNTGCGYYQDVLSAMTAEYVAVAHCDDKWMPEKLEKQVAFLDAHPEVAACFTQVQVVDEEDRPLQDEKHVYYRMFQQENRSRCAWLRFFFDQGNCLCHPSVLIRREAYANYGLFTNGLSGIPDFIQWVRLCHHAEIWIYPEKLSCFRVRKNEQNTSGDSADKHYRNFIEQFLTVGEYVQLDDPQEFLTIFPEAEQYRVQGELIVAYAYARILLEQPHSPMKHLYAFQLLYNLMQNPQQKQKLEQLYGYTQKTFEQEKRQEDIFSLIPGDRFMHCCLYVDEGDGFCEEKCLRATVYISHDDRFYVRFLLPESCKTVKGLRFDPDCNYWRILWDVCAWTDGKSVALVPVGAEQKAGKEQFFTLDSQYLMQGDFSSVRTVQIEGKCAVLPLAKIDEKIRMLTQGEYEARRRCDLLTQKTEELQKQLAKAVEERACSSQHEEQLQKAMTTLMDEIHAHPWRVVARILLKKM